LCENKYDWTHLLFNALNSVPSCYSEWTAVLEGERLQPLVAAARSVRAVASALTLPYSFNIRMKLQNEFLLLFQRWSTEVLWLIADCSGLIVDVARMVQGSCCSPIYKYSKSKITSEALFA
jgi:hypothetical protein